MFINVVSPLTFILITAVTILLIFLGQEIKKGYVAVLPLIMHLGLLITHTVQILTLESDNANASSTLAWCLVVDFVFILISFFAYLWVDDIEAKSTNKKNLDSSLDWFWKKI